MEKIVKASVRIALPLTYLIVMVGVLWWTNGHHQVGQATLMRQADALERIAAALEATAQK